MTSYSSTSIATIKIPKREKMQFLSAARQRFIILAMQLYKKFKNIAIINSLRIKLENYEKRQQCKECIGSENGLKSRTAKILVRTSFKSN